MIVARKYYSLTKDILIKLKYIYQYKVILYLFYEIKWTCCVKYLQIIITQLELRSLVVKVYINIDVPLQKFNLNQSGFCNHIANDFHYFDLDNIKVFYKEENLYQMLILEFLQIQNCNIKPDNNRRFQ